MTTTTDLGALFDEHVASEFGAQDVDATMATMTAEPYVWHVPAMTGAKGGEAVRDFYPSQFIGHTPEYANLHPISRTISLDRVVDESCSHALMTSRSPGCCPACPPPAGASAFRCWW